MENDFPAAEIRALTGVNGCRDAPAAGRCYNPPASLRFLCLPRRLVTPKLIGVGGSLGEGGQLTLKVDRPKLSPEDIKTLEEGMKKAAAGRE